MKKLINPQKSIKELSDNVSLILAKNRNSLSVEDCVLLEAIISKLNELVIAMKENNREIIVSNVRIIVTEIMKFFLSSELLKQLISNL